MKSENYYLVDKEFDIDEFLNEELGKPKLTKKGTLRKRKPKQPRVYFTEETEQAILDYLQEENQDIRNKIYNDKIEYAFYKLAENIIHTFKFYYTDTDTIEELKHEVITFLLSKLHLYKQGKGKAYSYFGTIAKRYLIIYNQNNYQKLQEKADIDEIEENQNILQDVIRSTNLDYIEDNSLSKFMDLYIKYIDINLNKLFPKFKDAQTADAILELFRKRESLNILENKKALYIYIREMINVETPQITKIVKKMKNIYIYLYNEFYETGMINFKKHG